MSDDTSDFDVGHVADRAKDDPDNTEKSIESDGRSVEIETGFYRVQVWGDPEDSLEETERLAYRAADRAKDDVDDLDDRLDGDDRHYG